MSCLNQLEIIVEDVLYSVELLIFICQNLNIPRLVLKVSTCLQPPAAYVTHTDIYFKDAYEMIYTDTMGRHSTVFCLASSCFFKLFKYMDCYQFIIFQMS